VLRAAAQVDAPPVVDSPAVLSILEEKVRTFLSMLKRRCALQLAWGRPNHCSTEVMLQRNELALGV